MPVNRIVDESAAGAVDGLSGDRNTQQMLTWLKDAGFGLFIHWSVDVQLGCVISHSLVGASREYADRFYDELPRTFNPHNWDADEVARLARISGAQYAVFTTKHHNGFCMWDTATTPFNIINTPYGRDIVAQYVQAFRAQGLKVGFYYSPEDFRFLYDNAQTITRTPTSPYPADVMARYRAYLTAQMTELMTKFGKIDLIFFDGGELMRDETGESLQELCKRIAWDLQPGILVTRGAIKTPEQSLPGVGMSIGVTRLFYVLSEQGLINPAVNTAPCDAIVLPMTEDTAFAAHVATVLRGYGVRTQLYTEQRKFKQKLSYASKLAIPYAVIIGEDELASGEVSLKDMNAGTQLRCTPEDAALAVRDGLKALASEKLIKVN